MVRTSDCRDNDLTYELRCQKVGWFFEVCRSTVSSGRITTSRESLSVGIADFNVQSGSNLRQP